MTLLKTKRIKSKFAYRVAMAIRGLVERGVRIEQIAIDLNCSTNAVYNWQKELRTPKFATIKYLEMRYGVKIL